MHTNYDIFGMADCSASRLGLTDTKVLSVTEEEGGHATGFGRVGKLPVP